MSEAIPVFATPGPYIRRVSVDRPWAWLASGWQDLIAAWRASLAYGLALVGFSVVLTLGLAVGGWFYLVLPLAAGFMLVAPILAVGLYEISRRHGLGEAVDLPVALRAYKRNGVQLALMGLALMLLHLAWVRIASLLFVLFFPQIESGPAQLLDLLISGASLPFLVVGTVIGAALAVIAFSVSAISIPMLLDQPISAPVAIATSVVAVRENWRPMALWAALIVVFTGVGMATFYVGLAIAWPLVAHASWHAYRDLVTEAGAPS
ncbi:MAG: DUF2189 domain-containing protein [Proteobacteria bacterium]|nr:DUF2189 domain-containing protein [Pseudomonadota bacterium]